MVIITLDPYPRPATSVLATLLDYTLQELIKNNLDTMHSLIGQKPMGLFRW